MDIFKWLVDIIYMVPIKVNRFKKSNVDETVIAVGASKGIKLNNEESVSYNPKWIGAKRSILILTDKRLKAGSWEIELSQIDKAQIVLMKSLFLIKGMVIKITTQDKVHYQFGVQYDSKFLKQKVLPLELIDEKIKYSLFSIIVRGFIILYLINLIIK